MSKTTSIYTRIEPELKEKVEQVLSRLGLPMASAINLFLHQIVIQNGLPFEIKIPTNRITDISLLTKEQFDAEMEKGFSDYKEGRTISSKLVRDEMQIRNK